MNVSIGDLTFGSSKPVCGPFCATADREGHPNEAPFTGTLLLVDQPSTKAPNGSEGHRILVPMDVAKRKLKTLIGMGINISDELDRHAPQKKVGVIKKAWIEGNKVMVSGSIWKKDFPNALQKLRSRGMGMSMELADVLVAEKDADVWKLMDFDFTGCTALYRSAAAYEKTSLAAAGQQLEKNSEKGERQMSKSAKTKTSGSKGSSDVNLLVAEIGKSIRRGFREMSANFATTVADLKASIDTQNETIAELAATGMTKPLVHDDAAAGADSSSADDDAQAAKDDAAANADSSSADDDAQAAAKDDEDDSEDDTSSEDDDELKAELEKLGKSMKNDLATDQSGDSDPQLGRLNDNAKNKGRKTSVSASASPNRRVMEIAASAVDSAQKARKEAKRALRSLNASRQRVAELEESVETMQAQIDTYTDSINRKSVPADVRFLLEKHGQNVNEMFASGEKLTVAQADQLLAAATDSGITMSPVDRMVFKTKMVEAGLLEQGEVKRY